MAGSLPAIDRDDRIVDLLACLADLRVQTAARRLELEQLPATGDPRASEALARLQALEKSLCEVGLEAASVHQLLRHVRLI